MISLIPVTINTTCTLMPPKGVSSPNLLVDIFTECKIISNLTCSNRNPRFPGFSQQHATFRSQGLPTSVKSTPLFQLLRARYVGSSLTAFPLYLTCNPSFSLVGFILSSIFNPSADWLHGYRRRPSQRSLSRGWPRWLPAGFSVPSCPSTVNSANGSQREHLKM